MRQSRKFLYIEAVLAALSALMLILTVAWPDWIEGIFGLDPDGGNGALEWTIAAAFLVATVVFSFMVRREWRRLGFERA